MRPMKDPRNTRRLRKASPRHEGQDAVIRDRLASIVDSSSDPIISKDLNAVVMSWNKGAEHIFGYTAAEMIGQPIARLIPGELEKEEPTILERLRRGERIDHYETVRVRKDG